MENMKAAEGIQLESNEQATNIQMTLGDEDDQTLDRATTSIFQRKNQCISRTTVQTGTNMTVTTVTFAHMPVQPTTPPTSHAYPQTSTTLTVTTETYAPVLVQPITPPPTSQAHHTPAPPIVLPSPPLVEANPPAPIKLDVPDIEIEPKGDNFSPSGRPTN